MRKTLQTLHFGFEDIDCFVIEPVRDEQHRRATVEHSPRPAPVEFGQRRADPRAARPVDHLIGDRDDRDVGIALA